MSHATWSGDKGRSPLTGSDAEAHSDRVPGPHAGPARINQQEEVIAMSGKMDQAKGRIKEAAGTLTGDEELEAEGRTDRLAGEAKEKDKVEDVIDKAKDMLHKK